MGLVVIQLEGVIADVASVYLSEANKLLRENFRVTVDDLTYVYGGTCSQEQKRIHEYLLRFQKYDAALPYPDVLGVLQSFQHQPFVYATRMEGSLSAAWCERYKLPMTAQSGPHPLEQIARYDRQTDIFVTDSMDDLLGYKSQRTMNGIPEYKPRHSIVITRPWTSTHDTSSGQKSYERVNNASELNAALLKRLTAAF